MERPSICSAFLLLKIVFCTKAHYERVHGLNLLKLISFGALCSVVGLGTAWSSKINVNVHKEVLPNGLTVLINENHQAPVIACRLFFTTGSVHEAPGRSGIAHMLEHMLFKGTKKTGVTDSILDAKYLHQIDSVRALYRNYKFELDTTAAAKELKVYDSLLTEHRKIMVKDELWDAYLKEGGTGLNAFTSDLMTAYFVTLPKNKLELYLWLEADRMQNGVLREFYPERDVVREERRMRYDDSPTGRYWETLYAVFYEAFPYRVPTIGWASDINNLTRQQAQEHYDKYYKPNNAILVLSGDIDPKEAMPKIRQYFEPIPRGEDHAKILIEEPEQVAAKSIVQYKDDATPRVDILFHTPSILDKDIYALDIIEGVLNGNSGRLYRNLVIDQGIATGAGAGNYADMYYSTFRLSLNLKDPKKAQEGVQALWKEIKRLQSEPIQAQELQKVKNQVLARTVRGLEDIEHLATQLAFYEMYGDWNIISTFPEGVQGVTAEEVQEAANKYFKYHLSTQGMILPESMSPAVQP